MNWKELQHTGVCLRNIHRNTKLLARTSLRRWHGSAISLARADAAQVGGDWVVYGLQIIMLLDSLIIFIVIIIIIICSSGPDLERRSSGGTESQSRAAGGAM